MQSLTLFIFSSTFLHLPPPSIFRPSSFYLTLYIIFTLLLCIFILLCSTLLLSIIHSPVHSTTLLLQSCVAARQSAQPTAPNSRFSRFFFFSSLPADFLIKQRFLFTQKSILHKKRVSKRVKRVKRVKNRQKSEEVTALTHFVLLRLLLFSHRDRHFSLSLLFTTLHHDPLKTIFSSSSSSISRSMEPSHVPVYTISKFSATVRR